MGPAMYHALPGWPYRQGFTVTRDGLERELMRMGMARRARLPGVSVGHGACYIIT